MTAQAPYESRLDVDALAQEIRRVDGSHSLGAGALAEALAPYIDALAERAPVSAGGDAVLPCDVLVAPATIVGKGCKVSTLMSVIEGRRENPPELTDEQRANLRKLLNVAAPAPPVGADWVVELRKVLEIAPNASTAQPMKWAAYENVTPTAVIDVLRNAVERTVARDCFTGTLDLIEESDTGNAIAYTGCGPKSAANAQFLIACAHFILRFGESLAAAPTPAEARGVGDGWQRKVFDALRTFAENDDPEGCAIGRPMFDVLTTLGLLRKVGRNLWEMTDAGEAALAANKPAGEVES